MLYQSQNSRQRSLAKAPQIDSRSGPRTAFGKAAGETVLMSRRETEFLQNDTVYSVNVLNQHHPLQDNTCTYASFQNLVRCLRRAHVESL